MKQFSHIVFLESATGYFRVHWSLWWQRKYPQIKARKKFSEKLLVMCKFISGCYMILFLEQLANTVFVKSAKGYLCVLWSLWWQWKYPQTKPERSFQRNCFVFCSFISQSYSFSLKKRFTKTVLVEFAKWYLEAHWGPWWKRKYPKIKTEKKLSEKLLCVLLFHLTELQPSPKEVFR